MAGKTIETKNAIFKVGYEWSHDKHDDYVLGENVDAFCFERGDQFLRAKDIQERIQEAEKYLYGRKPSVFIVDIYATKGQLKSTQRRIEGSMALRAAAATVLGREIYRLIKSRRAKKKAMQPPKEKKKSRAMERLSQIAAKLKDTRAGKVLANYYAALISKEQRMNPARRKFLKTSAVLGAVAAAEAISPELLREISPTREFAERIDIAHGDVVRALRNAVHAERLDSIVAPMLARELGRKPVIGIMLGGRFTGHTGFEAQLKNPALRRQTFKKFSHEIENMPFPKRREYIDSFRYDPRTQRYAPKVIKIPKLSGHPQASLSRRGLFRTVARESIGFAEGRVRKTVGLAQSSVSRVRRLRRML